MIGSVTKVMTELGGAAVNGESGYFGSHTGCGSLTKCVCFCGVFVSRHMLGT